MQKNSLNKVILIGNLGQDPEARFTPQGTAVTNLSIATNESWKDQSGEMQDRTEWHRVVMYGRMAETATEYMKKGQMVYVEGRLHTREWEDQNQIKRKTTEIRCDNFTMLGRRSDAPTDQSQGAMSPSPSAPASEVDDDLPF
jgi:single-strand DNA-binding protein